MKLLTHEKVSRRPVSIKIGFQFVILAVYFNPFSIEVNGVAEIFLSEFVVAVILE